MGADGDVLVRRVEWRIWLGIVGANLAVSLVIFPSAYYIVPVYFKSLDMGLVLRLGALAGSAYGVLGSIAGFFLVVRPIFRPSVRWIAEGRPPTEPERGRLATQPRRQATMMLMFWVPTALGGIPFVEHVGGVRMDLIFRMKFINGLVVLGFIAWTLCYLITERVIRPLLALAMADAPPSEPRTMRVFSRLLVAWTASAGLPFWAIVVSLWGLSAADRAQATSYVYATCALAGIAGIVATATAARAITDPLEKVRRGLRAVEEGDLNIDVPVDEASEIGVLQMGFNRMVHGLRERERLREIFGHHVGQDVAERAIGGNFALGGEVVDATAMFVDILGSSILPEQRPPEEVVGVLNAFFDAVVRCVGSEGGYVSKFEGDGALCVFGAPVRQPDHAARALRAAHALRSQVRQLSENVDAAIGVSSGRVVAGNIGAANRYEYTIVGDSVNEAARLTDEAKSRAGRILVSDRTLKLAQSLAHEWAHAGTTILRGRSTPTICYEPA